MGNILKKIILRLRKSQIKISHLISKWELDYNDNISIEKPFYLGDNTLIESKYGGAIKIGRNVEVLNNVIISTYGGNITIGNNCSINPGTIIYGHGNTIIGDDVLIAGHCMIIPTNHIYSNKNQLIRSQGMANKEITIEDDVWIGHGCTILAGVKIGKGSIVAAGAVVKNSVEPYSIVGGIPAKKIGER